MAVTKGFMGVDIGSISTKAVVIDEEGGLLAEEYLWTEGNPIGAVKRLLAAIRSQLDEDEVEIRGVGTTGSARELIGTVLGATLVKNEITAHAVGSLHFHPNIRTILRLADRIQRL